MHRLKTRAQFQAVLQAGSVVGRSHHFALHRLQLGPAAAARAALAQPAGVAADPTRPPAACAAVAAATAAATATATTNPPHFPAGGPWLGAMVPKRWARQAVTRNLIKRQIYSAAERHAHRLFDAAHVLRLRSSFDRQQFRSPGSGLLRAAVRDELDTLLQRVSP